MIFKQNLNLRYKEVVFQIVLHSLVFIFYAIDKRNPTIQAYQIPFFVNYALAAIVINYLLFKIGLTGVFT